METLSSQVLEFEGKTRANPIGEDLSDASFLGKLLVLPANVRLDWIVISRYKHSSLFDLSDKEKRFYNIDSWCQCYGATTLDIMTFNIKNEKLRIMTLHDCDTNRFAECRYSEC